MIFLIFVYILILIIGISNTSFFLVEDLKVFDGEYYVYTNSSYNLNLEDVLVVQNYLGQIYITDIENYKSILMSIENVACEKVVLKNIAVEEIVEKLKAKILEMIDVGNGIILYNCYSKNLQRSINSDVGKLNIQIAVTKDSICVGYPYLVDY